VIVAVPAAIPVTTPIEDIDAMEVSLLLHVPPDVLSLKVVVDPTHVERTPVIAEIAALTVTVLVVNAVPQSFVTV
jgi:hypothetical protein